MPTALRLPRRAWSRSHRQRPGQSRCSGVTTGAGAGVLRRVAERDCLLNGHGRWGRRRSCIGSRGGWLKFGRSAGGPGVGCGGKTVVPYFYSYTQRPKPSIGSGHQPVWIVLDLHDIRWFAVSAGVFDSFERRLFTSSVRLDTIIL